MEICNYDLQDTFISSYSDILRWEMKHLSFVVRTAVVIEIH